MRRPHLILRALVLAAATGSFAACGGGGGGNAPPPPPPPPPTPTPGPQLGTVTVLSANTCPSGPGAFANTACRHLRIDGAGNAAMEVELRVTDPVSAVPLRGTVVLSSGGIGVDFIGEMTGGDELVAELLTLGFRVVDRRWPVGWFSTGTSVRDQSNRFATLLTWVHDNEHGVGTFCAVGNSGGAAEIAYALTAWQRGDLLDVVVLMGGPPATRLDFLCGQATPAWFVKCASLVPAGAQLCPTRCIVSPANVSLCQALPSSPAPGELEADSVLAPGALLDYPNTTVHCVFGNLDCSVAVPQGLLYADAVQSAVTTSFVDSVHFVPTTAPGRAAVTSALLAPPTAGLIRVEAPAAVAEGASLRLELRGPADAPFAVLSGLPSAAHDVAGLGLLHLRPFTRVADGRFGASAGRVDVALSLPTDAALVGTTLYHQVLTVEGLSGLVATRVIP